MKKFKLYKKPNDVSSAKRKDVQLNFQLSPWEEKTFSEINAFKNCISIDQIGDFSDSNSLLESKIKNERTQKKRKADRRESYTGYESLKSDTNDKRRKISFHKSFHNLREPKSKDRVYNKSYIKEKFLKQCKKVTKQNRKSRNSCMRKKFEGLDFQKKKQNKKSLIISKTTISYPHESQHLNELPSKNSFQYRLSYSNILRYGKLLRST